MKRGFHSLAFLAAAGFLLPMAALAGPVRVVVPQDGYLGAKSASRGKPYLVFQKNASISSLNDKRIDIEASQQYCDELISKGLVKQGKCEPDGIVTMAVSPNDPRHSDQYAITRTSLLSAWDTTTGGKSVVVAIVDTGIQYTHPDLNANIWTNSNETRDGIDNDGNGFIDDAIGWDFVDSDNDPDDLNEHGTHCAGITAAVGNNATGVTGAAWSASIMPVRVLDANGSGFLSDVATGVRYAVDNGASVLSLSLGGSSSSQVLKDALSYACTKGAFVAVAAGNESANNDVTPSYPANYDLPCLISVAATDSSDALADFSNYGATTVHVAAPGVQILSTVPGNSYGLLSGTSMATPLVAGIGVLVKASKSSLSGTDIKSIIMQSVDSISGLSGRVSTGGRVNAANALAVANGTTPSPPAPAPSDPSDPGSGDGAERAIEFERAEVMTKKRKGIVSGYYYEVESEAGVEGAILGVACEDRRGRLVFADVTPEETDEEGYFEIVLRGSNYKALAKGGTCYVSSDDVEAKKRLRVKR